MAKIFVSHSRHERDVIDFLARVAAGTQVQLIFAELEAFVNGPVTAEGIQADIEASNAVFVVVTPNVTALAHSRDWIAWETGIGARRDVWVLEKREHAGQVRVVTPSLKHLVRFDPSDPWFAYFRAIITSYDDSHVLPALVAGGTVGNAFRRGEGAIVGAGIALIITSMLTQQPRGVPIVCGKCSSRYSVHLPSGEPQFRCPVCNEVLGLALTQPVLGALPPAAG